MSRRKTIRPSVEAGPAKLLVLFLCSPPAAPLADSSPPQAANNSRQSPMRRPINSPTRRDGFPISEWYIPCSFLSSFSFAYLTARFVLASLAPLRSHLLPTSRPYERPLRTLRSFLHSMDLLSEVLEPDMLTLGVPLSWEVGDGFLICSGNYSQEFVLSLGF